MSVSADISLMDILFDRDDPVLKFVDDRDVFKQDVDGIDVKTDLLSDKFETWATETDDFFKDILSGEQFNNLLDKNGEDARNDNLNLSLCDWKPVTDDGSGVKEVIVGSASSTYSDSGLSCDQVSPGLPSSEDFTSCVIDDDEHMSSAVSSVSDSSVHYSQDKFEMQDLDFFDATEDEQAVMSLLAQESQTSGISKRKLRHIVRDSSGTAASNPRSILLPVSTGNGIRTYKIVSGGASSRKSLKAVGSIGTGNQMVIKSLRQVKLPLVNVRKNVGKKMKVKIATEPPRDYTDEEGILSDSEDDKIKTQYPRLILSPEERKLMQKEGVTLPTHYPLTKFEERELKRIRRKIRNKISAQDSRKRKKEYLDGLEDRVKQCTEENLSLVKKIKFLQSQNQSLMTQLKKLQMTLARTSTKTAQPATCLMVIMLSVALVMAPNLRLTQNNEKEVSEQDFSASDPGLAPIAGRTRSLLSKSNFQEGCSSTEEEETMPSSAQDVQELFRFCSASKWSPDEEEYSDRSRKSSVGSSTSGYDSPPHFLADHDYDPPPSKRSRFRFESFKPYNGQALKKEFIVPPVDDVWPERRDETVKPKEFIIPEVDDEWIPAKSALSDKIESITTEVKVNISDSKGTRTVLIQVPKKKNSPFLFWGKRDGT